MPTIAGKVETIQGDLLTINLAGTAPPNPPNTTLIDAYDMVQLVIKGYEVQADGDNYPIQIARVVGQDSTYMITASGTDSVWNYETGLPADIAASLGTPDHYALAISQLVHSYIPSGSKLWLAGDSLGGMVCQNAAYSLWRDGYVIDNLVTFNSPQTQFFYGFGYGGYGQARRFRYPGDLVVWASPFGLRMSFYLNPEQTQLDEEVIANPYLAHIAIYKALSLHDWDPLGRETFPVQEYTPNKYFPAVVLGPINVYLSAPLRANE